MEPGPSSESESQKNHRLPGTPSVSFTVQSLLNKGQKCDFGDNISHILHKITWGPLQRLKHTVRIPETQCSIKKLSLDKITLLWAPAAFCPHILPLNARSVSAPPPDNTHQAQKDCACRAHHPIFPALAPSSRPGVQEVFKQYCWTFVCTKMTKLLYAHHTNVSSSLDSAKYSWFRWQSWYTGNASQFSTCSIGKSRQRSKVYSGPWYRGDSCMLFPTAWHSAPPSCAQKTLDCWKDSHP